MGKVGTDEAIKHHDMVVFHQSQQQRSRFKSITRVQHGCQLRMYFVQLSKSAVQEIADG